MKCLQRSKKRILAFVLSLVMLLSSVPVDSYAAGGTATWEDINQDGVFMSQTASGYCTFFSNMMMVRRDQIIKGNKDWASIDASYCKSIMWTSGGMTWKYGIYDTEVRYSTSAEKTKLKNMSATEKCDFFKNLLKTHPEGIVIYEITSNSKYNGKHAVLLTDFTDGMFYVADPSRNKKAARVPITESLVDITEVDSFWIVENPSTLKNNYCVVGSAGNNTKELNPGYPYPIPDSSVRLGTKGEYAKWLEQALKTVIGSDDTVDGVIGVKTVYYTKKFQYMYGLSEDGICGTDTRNLIISAYQGKTKAKKSGDSYPAYGSEKEVTDTENPGYPYDVPSTSVKSTSSGDSVYWLQTALNNTIKAGIVANGVFTNETEYYVKKFQYMYGLSVDGVTGPATRAKLIEVYKGGVNPVNSADSYPAFEEESADAPLTTTAAPKQETTEAPSETETPSTTGSTDNNSNPGAPYSVPEAKITSNSKADDIKWLQTALKTVINANLTVDGNLNDITTYYVKKFQYMYGLTEDGVVGAQTRKAIVSAYTGEKKAVKNGSDYPEYTVGEYIKGICQMPYEGKGGGYLIGFESIKNPNQSYQYEMLILDCTLYAQGKNAWVYSTGKQKLKSGTSLWTVWQPMYGYYWTLFRLYDADGNMLEQICYGFANI